MAYFPMFIDLKTKNVLIVGGGIIAYRKILTLLEFEANDIRVVAPHVIDEIKDLDITLILDEYDEMYLEYMDFAIAATDDKELNHRIANDCRRRNIFVNAVDQVEDCDYIFPSYIKNKNVIAAFSSSGNSPVLTQYLKNKNQDIVTDSLGSINEYMGSIRKDIQERIPSNKRKEIYKRILNACIDKERPLDCDELEELLNNE